MRARGIQLEGGPGCRSQVYFPPRRRLIARQRRHVNDGNDGAGEAKANGCIQRTKALLCSRHVIDGEWFTVSLPDAGEKRLPSNASGGRCTRRDAVHQQGCTPDPVGAFIAANLRGGLVLRRKRVIYIAS